jgi:hypothetical protein
MFVNGSGRNEEAARPNDMTLGKKHLWKILYRDYSFRFDPFTNLAATDNSCFRLVKLLTKCHIIWPSGFRGKAVLEIDQ